MRYGMALLLVLAVTGCATTIRESQFQEALSLTKEHFKSTAAVTDDSLDTVAMIITVNGVQEKRGLLGIVWDDNFLRAFIMEGRNPDDAGDFRKAALFLKRTFVSGGERTPAKVSRETAQADGGNEDLHKEMTVIKRAAVFRVEEPGLRSPVPQAPRLSECIIKAFGLGYCNRGLMKGRVAIPLHDEFGYLIGYAGRVVDDSAINETTPRYLYPGSRERSGMRYEFHKSEFLYNGYKVKGATDLVVVESFSAVWRLAEAEIVNAVAVMGASVSEKQARLITELVLEDGRVWILSDGDQAGERMAESVFRLIAPHRFVRWVKLGDGKQPTDLSPDELHKILPVV